MNMIITEPMTMLTDYAVAIETLLFAILLFRSSHRQRKTSVRLWGIGFSLFAVAAILGGTYHGFAYYLGEAGRKTLWQGMIYLLSFSSLFMFSGTVINSIPNRFHKICLALIAFKSLVYLSFAVNQDSFRYVLVDYLSVIIAILVLQAWVAYRYKQRSAVLISSGIIILLVAAGAQQSRFTLAENFNYNDLSHIISMVGFYFLYRGSRLLKDWGIK
jgi:hypothetical protein